MIHQVVLPEPEPNTGFSSLVGEVISLVKEGDKVSKGDQLVEFDRGQDAFGVTSEHDGVVVKVHTELGKTIASGELVVDIEV